eukprot:1829543-Rhodomonas_salina.1
MDTDTDTGTGTDADTDTTARHRHRQRHRQRHTPHTLPTPAHHLSHHDVMHVGMLCSDSDIAFRADTCTCTVGGGRGKCAVLRRVCRHEPERRPGALSLPSTLILALIL